LRFLQSEEGVEKNIGVLQQYFYLVLRFTVKLQLLIRMINCETAVVVGILPFENGLGARSF
jgi:hypothetical protein